MAKAPTKPKPATEPAAAPAGQDESGAENKAATVPGQEDIDADPPLGGASMISDVDSNEAAHGSGVAAALDDMADAMEDANDKAIERMVDRVMNIVDDASIDGGSLVGDIRDTLIDAFKVQQKPWSQLLEHQQRSVAQGLESAAKALLLRVVTIVAADQAKGQTIRAKLESYAEKGGIKITLTANGDDHSVLALHRAVGKMVVISQADSSDYNGERREASIQPDQPDLGFEGGEAEHPHDDADLADGATDALDNAEADADATFNVYDPAENEWLGSDDNFWPERKDAAAFTSRSIAEAEAKEWNEIELLVVKVGEEPPAA